METAIILNDAPVALSVTVTPGQVVENFDAYKAAAIAKAEAFKGCDLSALPLKQVKDYRAYLNSEAKLINDQRLSWERVYMEPFADYKRKSAELVAILKKAADELGQRVKEADEQWRQQRHAELEGYYLDRYGLLAEVVPFGRILDERWLNRTQKHPPEDAIDAAAMRAAADWEALKGLGLANHEQAELAFFRTLDIGQAVAEDKRITDEADKLAAFKAEVARREEAAAERARLEALADPETGELPDEPEPVPEPTPAPVPEPGDTGRYIIEATCPLDAARAAAKGLSDKGYDVRLRRA
jgi:hypothetical protein